MFKVATIDGHFKTLEELKEIAASWAKGHYVVWQETKKMGYLEVTETDVKYTDRSSPDNYVPGPYVKYIPPPKLFGPYEPEMPEPGKWVLKKRGPDQLGTINWIMKRAMKHEFGLVASETVALSNGHQRTTMEYRGPKKAHLKLETTIGMVGGPEWIMEVVVL